MNINSIKILDKDMDKLVRIHQKLVVDFPEGKASESEVLSSIKASGIKVIPKGALKAMKQEQIVFVSGEDIYLRPINKNKGGDNMEKAYKHSGVTPGEQKVAEAILDHFKPAFEMGRIPSKMVFMSCLESALPSINKKVKADLAFKKMINNHYLEEQNNKIILGVNGKDYLSL